MINQIWFTDSLNFDQVKCVKQSNPWFSCFLWKQRYGRKCLVSWSWILKLLKCLSQIVFFLKLLHHAVYVVNKNILIKICDLHLNKSKLRYNQGSFQIFHVTINKQKYLKKLLMKVMQLQLKDKSSLCTIYKIFWKSKVKKKI